MQLKELRKSKNLTQAECATYLNIPLRTYKTYENDETKRNTVKYAYMLEKLNEFGVIDEERGILTIDRIKDECRKILPGYEVKYCFLFGSYAKGKANEKSDVDLLVSTTVTGLRFYGLAEELREVLHKKVDVLNQDQLVGNKQLIDEILKDGIKIYG